MPYVEQVAGGVTRLVLTSSRNFSSSLSEMRTAAKMVPTKREIGSTNARMRLLVLGGPALTINLLPLIIWPVLEVRERERLEDLTGKEQFPQRAAGAGEDHGLVALSVMRRGAAMVDTGSASATAARPSNLCSGTLNSNIIGPRPPFGLVNSRKTTNSLYLHRTNEQNSSISNYPSFMFFNFSMNLSILEYWKNHHWSGEEEMLRN